MLKTLHQIQRVGLVSESSPTDELPALQEHLHRIIGRALCIRAVDAGSCNGCELELHALNNPYYNLEGVGLKFVASPRHADLLLVTGPVSAHMAAALRRTYEATPDPKWVVAVGDCGCNGGVFGCGYASLGGVDRVIPVDASVPGCPPSPRALLAGILEAVRKPPAEPGVRPPGELCSNLLPTSLS